MANDERDQDTNTNDFSRQEQKALPQAEEAPLLSDGREHLGGEFERPVPRENRALGEEFTERNTYEGRHLGEEYADTTYGDERKLGRAFDDPNSLDDTKLGNEFVKSQSSAKKHHRPVGEVVTEPFTKPKNKKVLFLCWPGSWWCFCWCSSSAGSRGTSERRRARRRRNRNSKTR